MRTHTQPKVIYSLWLQGANDAPELVRMCFERWASLNPGYELRVLDSDGVRAELAGSTIPFESMTPQALSDVVRARLLSENGGIWVDATLFPMRPLETWLPNELSNAGFFAFDRPGEDRPLSSWFLAAARPSIVLRRWWEEIERFWSRPRSLATYRQGMVPDDPVATVSPLSQPAADEFPYFWFHYLFRYLIENEEPLSNIWSRVEKRSAGPPHQLQNLFASSQRPSRDEIAAVASTAPVQKLNWRTSYPLDVLASL